MWRSLTPTGHQPPQFGNLRNHLSLSRQLVAPQVAANHRACPADTSETVYKYRITIPRRTIDLVKDTSERRHQGNSPVGNRYAMKRDFCPPIFRHSAQQMMVALHLPCLSQIHKGSDARIQKCCQLRYRGVVVEFSGMLSCQESTVNDPVGVWVRNANIRRHHEDIERAKTLSEPPRSPPPAPPTCRVRG